MSETATVTKRAETGAVFEPRIVAFVCKWCTYAGADLAGTSRMVYPPNVRTLMLPCTGRIDVSFVVRAFCQGADGVIVSGCHPGDCHYTAGNFRARRRWTLFRDLLDTLGVDLRRVEFAWISAAEGGKWVKTISAFTNTIRELGPFESMQRVVGERSAPLAPPATVVDEVIEQENTSGQPDPALAAAIAEALTAGKVKVVVGWGKSVTMGKPRPAWITSAEAAAEVAMPGGTGNLVRLFKNTQLRAIAPIGIVARASELLSLNVLLQESQLDPKNVVIFAVDSDGKFVGASDCETAAKELLGPALAATDRPTGFSAELFKTLDNLMTKTPAERWKFWSEQSAKCIKCYACRQSCPMCNCDRCFVDNNQPQWFPTAADGPGNFSWHLLRGFHLAGRCVGCGACQSACPAGIPLNLLSAAMARSALKHFGHRAGVDAKALPLQSQYRPDDKEDFIL